MGASLRRHAAPGNCDRPSRQQHPLPAARIPGNRRQGRQARRPARKVNWLVEVRGLVLMLLAVVAFHSLLAKPFYIPSQSMMPNLLVGDRLVVSKYPYGWSWVSASFHILPRGDGESPARPPNTATS